MKASYCQRGETLDYTPAEDLEAGEVVSLGSRIGVAAETIRAGEPGHLYVVGVYAMAKADGEAIDQGAAVYYDTAAETITTKESISTEGGDDVESSTSTESKTVPAGYAAASAAATDSTVLVKLLG